MGMFEEKIKGPLGKNTLSSKVPRMGERPKQPSLQAPPPVHDVCCGIVHEDLSNHLAAVPLPCMKHFFVAVFAC